MTEKSTKPQLRFAGFDDTWEQRKLGDIVTVYDGVHQTPNYQTSGVMFLSVENIATLKSNKFISFEDFKRDYKVYPQRNDILMTRIGDVGTTNVVTDNDVKAYYVSLALLKYKETNPFFLSSAIQSDFVQEGLSNRTLKTAIPMKINKDEIGQVDAMLPTSADEQDKIGSFFSQLDTLITLHQRKYDKLTNVKKSMLEKMFPKNGSNVPEIRFKGFSDAWEQRKLSDVATMHARIGWQNLRTSEFLDSGDYMLITGTDFNDGAVNYSTCHFVEKERYEQDKHIQIKNGSILITKDGTLGKVAYVQGLSMPATLNAGVFNVEIKDETKVDNKYLFQYLKAPFLMDYVDKKATGGTIKHLNQNILVDFPVVMPSKAEQEAIGVYFQQLDNLITLHQRELEKLKNLKKACLEKMFV